jgi:hypothetical protein
MYVDAYVRMCIPMYTCIVYEGLAMSE